ncbi:MAG TPA: hypothetical protein EYN54_11805 [Methylococcaceae bacterium]|nr:hypothetical protein [Methylococcaceae bacterium]
MAQLPPVILNANTWVNVYAETGITVGVKLIIQNNGDNMTILADSLSEPTSNFGFNNIPPSEYLISAAIPDGVWARSELGSIIQVAEA